MTSFQIPVHPDHGEPIAIAPRRSYSPAQRRKIWEQRQGVCLQCGALVPWNSPWHAAHDRTRALGGGNEIENLWPACAPCNLDRAYQEEIPAVAKAKRQAGETGQQARRKRRGPKMKSKPFDKTRTRQFDGTVVERKPRS